MALPDHSTNAARPKRGVYLVGFSGSGKSTIANLVAEKLGCRACDLDDFIVERSGMLIPAIFKEEGEEGFRVRESDALRAASSDGRFVIATGGGTVVRPENRELMSSNGWIVLLEAQPEVLHARLQRQVKSAGSGAIRPLLDAADPLEQIRALKDARQSAYSFADWTIHTDQLTVKEVATEVVRAVEALERSGSQ